MQLCFNLKYRKNGPGYIGEPLTGSGKIPWEIDIFIKYVNGSIYEIERNVMKRKSNLWENRI